VLARLTASWHRWPERKRQYDIEHAMYKAGISGGERKDDA
jgi:hypothetical protein